MKKIKGQYIVTVEKSRRVIFVNYIKDNYKLKIDRDIDSLLDSTFPFVVDFDKKILWICNSITCLAQASSHGKIIDEKQFILQLKKT